MKVRKHDLQDIIKFNPKILEFHFSQSDLDLTLEEKFEKDLIVHCYEYFDRKLLDIVNASETNQLHSQEKTIELVQKAIDKTVELSENFKGKPTLILHPGGYSLNELEDSEVQDMKERLIENVSKLDVSKINFLLENMPPYAWFFGGRWISNVFLDAEEMKNYSKKTGHQVCFDLCHSHLYCNKNNKSLVDELAKIKEYVFHYHISDASGVDGEGLQIGEGDLPFEEIIPILNKQLNKGFAIEVWQGHLNGGIGFKKFLTEIQSKGLIVN